MRLSTATLLLLLASSLSPGHGILEAHYTNLKCRCVRTTSNFINPNLIERFQVIPPGNGCPRKEIIIRTKKKLTLCLNPQAKWIQKVLKHLQGKNISSTPPAPVSKKRIS